MKYKIQKGLIVEKLDKDLVIFDADQSVLYTLNETASFIFQQLKRGWDEKKIIQGLVKKYQIKEKRVKKDVNELISDLKKKKIVYFSRSKK